MSSSSVTISEDSRAPGILVRSNFRRSAQGREIVLVLGMHRSGTSLLANILHLLGVDMVDRPTHASSNNETGFWERDDLVAVQDEILQVLGAPVGSPAHVVPFPAGWWRSVEIRPLKDKLRDLVDGHLKAVRRPWGFKDPRTCRLLPLWGEILEELDVSPRFVWAVRHPAESSRSMTAKNPLHRPIPVQQSEVMWLAYNYDILRYTGRHWPLIVPYDGWFGDSLALAKEIAGELDLIWQGSDHELEAALLSLVNPLLRHHASEQGKLRCSLALSEEVYRSILVMRNMPEANVGETVALSLQSLLGAVQPFAVQAVDAKAAREETQRLTAELETSRSRLGEASATIAALEVRGERQRENEGILVARSETLLTKLADARAERDAAVEVRSKLETELAAAQQARDQAANELARVTAQLSSANDRLATASAERDQAIKDATAVRSAHDTLAADFADLGPRLEAFRKQALQSETLRKEAEQKLANGEAQRQSLQADVASLNAKLDGFRSKYAKVLSQLEETQKSLAEGTAERDRLQAELAASFQHIEAAAAAMDSARAELQQRVESAESEATALRGEIAALQQQLDERRAGDEAGQARAQRLASDVERMKADLAAMRQTLRSERERFAEALAAKPGVAG